MSFDTDLLLDRRRLKRRLVFWRILTVLALAVAAIAGLRGVDLPSTGDRIVRISVTGLITADSKLTDAISALADDRHVKGVILFIDSPGGSVAGGEALHDAVQRLAARVPLVAVMGGTAASAGYMVAVPAARIFAHQATLTGSIGVLLETGEISGLLEKLGVSAEVVRSGPLKDEPSFVRPLSPAGRNVLQGIVDDLYDQFVTMVAVGRHLPEDKVRLLADGRPYTGRQALALGLVDVIGGEREAKRWLETDKGIQADLPVQDLTTSRYASRLLSESLNWMLQGISKTLISQSLSLDGPWAVWHRSGN